MATRETRRGKKDSDIQCLCLFIRRIQTSWNASKIISTCFIGIFLAKRFDDRNIVFGTTVDIVDFLLLMDHTDRRYKKPLPKVLVLCM